MRKQFKRIICATDFSDYSNYTLPYGIALARVFEAELHVCHVIDLPSVHMYGEAVIYTEEQEDRIRRYAGEEIGRLIGEQPIPWEPLIMQGPPAGEIARAAREKNADLVIAATHGRSGLSRLVIGSVTERLMRTLPCPLLIVRGRMQDMQPAVGKEIKFKRLLVGYDFSPDSNLALEYGLSLAQEFEAELHLAHVIEPPIYKDLVRTERRAEEGAMQEDLRSRLTRELKAQIPNETHLWCTPKEVLLAGQPHEELTKYAVVQDMDLVVLGIHGRGLVEDLFVGSTTDRVAREAPCPVLSVRPVGSP